MDGHLPESQRKEQFSRAYVRAVAAWCGFEIQQSETDYMGIDLSIRGLRPPPGSKAFPQIDVQLKCTQNLEPRNDGTLAWQVDSARTYDLLKEVDVAIPRILVLMKVPPDRADWLSHDEEFQVARNGAYYFSLHGAPDRTVERPTLKIPKSQVFNRETLPDLMLRASRGDLKLG